MTEKRYNTGNALGSVAVKDLYDNAANFDLAVNSEESTFKDRLGKVRMTLIGYELKVTEVIADVIAAADRAAASATAAAESEADAETAAAAAADSATAATAAKNAAASSATQAATAADRAEEAASLIPIPRVEDIGLVLGVVDDGQGGAAWETTEGGGSGGLTPTTGRQDTDMTHVTRVGDWGLGGPIPIEAFTPETLPVLMKGAGLYSVFPSFIDNTTEFDVGLSITENSSFEENESSGVSFLLSPERKKFRAYFKNNINKNRPDYVDNPVWPYLKFGIHADDKLGTEPSSITEVKNRSFDVINNVVDSGIVSEKSLINGRALKFNGSVYLKTNGDGFDFSGNFYISMWIFWPSAASRPRGNIISFLYDGGSSGRIMVEGSDIKRMKMSCSSGGSGVNSGSKYLPLDKPVFVEYTRDGVSERIFFNGVQVGVASIAATTKVINSFCVGASELSDGSVNYSYVIPNGTLIRDLQVVCGVAGNTSNYTPPSVPFFTEYMPNPEPIEEGSSIERRDVVLLKPEEEKTTDSVISFDENGNEKVKKINEIISNPISNTYVSVFSIEQTPTETPSSNNSYIVGVGATGAWAGHDNDVAVWDGSAWVFYTPKIGWLCDIQDENTILTFRSDGWHDYIGRPEWVANKSYSFNQRVFHAGLLWASLADGNSTEPSASAALWQIVPTFLNPQVGQLLVWGDNEIETKTPAELLLVTLDMWATLGQAALLDVASSSLDRTADRVLTTGYAGVGTPILTTATATQTGNYWFRVRDTEASNPFGVFCVVWNFGAPSNSVGVGQSQLWFPEDGSDRIFIRSKVGDGVAGSGWSDFKRVLTDVDIPVSPPSGNYTLKSLNGVVSWVEE